MRVCERVHVCVCIRVCVHVCVCACMRACMHACTCMYTYMYACVCTRECTNVPVLCLAMAVSPPRYRRLPTCFRLLRSMQTILRQYSLPALTFQVHVNIHVCIMYIHVPISCTHTCIVHVCLHANIQGKASKHSSKKKAEIP